MRVTPAIFVALAIVSGFLIRGVDSLYLMGYTAAMLFALAAPLLLLVAGSQQSAEERRRESTSVEWSRIFGQGPEQVLALAWRVSCWKK